MGEKLLHEPVIKLSFDIILNALSNRFNTLSYYTITIEKLQEIDVTLSNFGRATPKHANTHTHTLTKKLPTVEELNKRVLRKYLANSNASNIGKNSVKIYSMS